MSTDDLDFRRIAAGSAALLFHLTLLLFLLSEHSPAFTRTSSAILVRLIPDQHSAAGAPNNSEKLEVPSAVLPAHVEVPPAPRSVRVAISTRKSVRPTERIQVLDKLAPPPETIKMDGVAPSSESSFRSTTTLGASRDSGNGHNGDTDSGRSEGIKLLTKARPSLPQSLRGRNWNGYVLLGLRVPVDGTPSEIVVLRSSGIRAVDLNATVAAAKSTYLPHRMDGKPVEFWAILPVVFGSAEPDVRSDLANLAQKWRSSHPGADLLGKTRPA